MRVLWFCNTSSKAYGDVGTSGSWISSLEEIVSENKEIELAIGFENNKEKRFFFKNTSNRTVYYPIKRYNPNPLRKLYNNLTYKVNYNSDIPQMLRIIDHFKPDLIQIMGSEEFFCKIISHTNTPIIIHIQGILHKYIERYLPEGISFKDIILVTNPIYFLMGGGYFHKYFQLKKKAEREVSYLTSTVYLMGRTDWDKRVMLNLTPGAKYFHCEESLRKEFFNYRWHYPYDNKNPLIITSVLSDLIYKGLDTVLVTASIMKNKGFSYEWRIIGISNESDQIRLFEKKAGLKFKSLNVKFLGRKNVNDLVNLMVNSHLFVHPSHIENSPNCICEAMLLGVPVIAVDNGGVNSIISNDFDGILVRDYDPDELAEKILSYNSIRAFKISENAFNTAQYRHNKDRILDNLLEIYQDILNMKN